MDNSLKDGLELVYFAMACTEMHEKVGKSGPEMGKKYKKSRFKKTAPRKPFQGGFAAGISKIVALARAYYIQKYIFEVLDASKNIHLVYF